MKSRITFCIVVIILGLAAAASSQTKIGTGYKVFLEYTPSVRIVALGEAGTALIDNNSAVYNPATLGLYHRDHRAQLTAYPASTRTLAGFEYRYYSASVRVFDPACGPELPFSVSVGYFRTRANSQPIEATTYEYPAGTGETFSVIDNAHDFVMALSASKILDFGAGITYRFVDESATNVSTSGHGFNLGLIIRLPSDRIIFPSTANAPFSPFFSPSAGFAWCNIDTRVTVDNFKYTLGDFQRLGFAAPLGLKKITGRSPRTVVMITPTVELMLLPGTETRTRFGLELELMEAVAGRFGRSESVIGDTKFDANTLGFGVNSRGLIRLIGDLLSPQADGAYSPLMKILRDDLSVKFSFARKSMPDFIGGLPADDYDFCEISIEY